MISKALECAHCSKQEKVLYKTSDSDYVGMCANCPELEEKINALCEGLISEEEKIQEEQHLLCAHCQASLDSIRKGKDFGCTNCLSVFGDLLIDEALNQNTQLSYPKTEECSSSLPSLQKQLSLLNKQLKESLEQELYEQAAFFRDQIQSLLQKQIC